MPTPFLTPRPATPQPTPSPQQPTPSGSPNGGGGAEAQVTAWQHDTTCPVNPAGETYCDCVCCTGAFCDSQWVGSFDTSTGLGCSADTCRMRYYDCPQAGANGALSVMQSRGGALISGKVKTGKCETEGLNGGSYILTCAADDSWTLQLYRGETCAADSIINSERYTGYGRDVCSAHPLSTVLRGGSVKVDCNPPRDSGLSASLPGVSFSAVQIALPIAVNVMLVMLALLAN